jgi:hypothetical protein
VPHDGWHCGNWQDARRQHTIAQKRTEKRRFASFELSDAREIEAALRHPLNESSRFFAHSLRAQLVRQLGDPIERNFHGDIVVDGAIFIPRGGHAE